MTGTNAIITQINDIVSGILPTLSDYVGLIINGVGLLGVLSSVGVLARIGRRPLTLFGNLVLGVIDIFIGILFIF